jgi:hypothetical protein
MFPLCHLTLTLRFFQSNRLGFVAKIYPFLGFEPSLEYLPGIVTSMATYHVHMIGSLEIPLMGFFFLQHLSFDGLPGMNIAMFTANTCKV